MHKSEVRQGDCEERVRERERESERGERGSACTFSGVNPGKSCTALAKLGILCNRA